MDENEKTYLSLTYEFYHKFNQAKFELLDQEYVVKEYYSDLRTELAKELKGLEIELSEKILDQIDNLIDTIDDFEKNTIKIYESNNKEKINEFISKLNKMIYEKSRFLINSQNV